jgi:peroxiredoxin
MMPAVLAAWLAVCAAQPIPDFELPDPTGAPVRLSTHAQGRPVVLVFFGTECPLANLYAPRLAELARTLEPGGVRFLAVDPVPQDGLPGLARFARQHRLPFPVVKDPDARVASLCVATRTPEVVLLDPARRVRYRGRIDDQYEPGGKNRGRPTRHDLAEAVRELLAGGPVSAPQTPAFGCLIPRPKATRPAPSVVYHRDIAPILQVHCQACHRTGEVAPFALATYADARHWAPMMAEVTAGGTMPPWHANPDHGRFRNDRRLTASQKKLLGEWVEAGCPEGDPADAPPPVQWPDGWAVGTPDQVLKMAVPFRVPAEGVIEYQHAIVDPGSATDLWVTAAEVRPGNRRVLHHCNVYLQPPEATDPEDVYETAGTLGSYALVAWTPGSGPLRLPPGMAKRIPAGWKLHFVLHYTPIGLPTDDQTELGLTLADPKHVHKEVATKLVKDLDLRIPPGAAAHRIEHAWRADADFLLLSLFPHMHLRGKSFTYTAEYPDGSSEVLLDVPAYDFNWQHRYELAEPKRLPAGTRVRCVAVYDNSAGNPANPDPTAEVRAGQQSWEEMFNGYFDVALADQDLQAPVPSAGTRRPLAVGACAVALIAGLGLYSRRARRRAEI